MYGPAVRCKGISSIWRMRSHREAALQQEGADLIDDTGALPHQPLAHAMQRLQVELIGRLGRDEPHRRSLHRLGDRLGITEIVLLSLVVRAHVSRWHSRASWPSAWSLRLR